MEHEREMHASRWPVTAILTLALSGAPLAVADAQLRASIGAAAGATIPMSGFGDRTNTGYHVMVTLGVHAPMVPLSLRIEGMYNEFDYNSDGGALFRSANRTARVLGATANGILTSSGILGPYLIGGIGVYQRTEAEPVLGGTVSSNNFGGNIGGGLRFELSGFSAYGEVRYHWVGDSDVRFIPITFGLTF